MIKILQTNISNTFAGIEKLELEYVKHINDEELQVDVLVPYKNSLKNSQEAMNNNHIFDFNIPKFTRRTEWVYDYKLFKLLKKNKYDILHINSSVLFFSLRTAIIAKMCGVKKVIVHSHGNVPVSKIKRIFIKIINLIFRKHVDLFLSCSKDALKPLLAERFIKENKAVILKNGIEIEQYKFKQEKRDELRKELKIVDKTVYGHVGRFEVQKNHDFLINLFNKIQQIDDNSVLLLIGIGSLQDKIREKVNELNLSSKVLFLGFRNDVNDLLNAMDCFLFPSFNEGLGIAAIEAQTNGLVTFCSTNVPIEANISERFHYFDLNEDVDKLAKRICNIKKDIENRKNAYEDTIKNDYSIESTCNRLREIYLKLL